MQGKSLADVDQSVRFGQAHGGGSASVRVSPSSLCSAWKVAPASREAAANGAAWVTTMAYVRAAATVIKRANGCNR